MNSRHLSNAIYYGCCMYACSVSTTTSVVPKNEPEQQSSLQTIVTDSYHKIKELYASSLSKYAQGKYFNALESFLECFELVERELHLTDTLTTFPTSKPPSDDFNSYYYLYYQICFQLAKCHFKLGQLNKAIFYLYHKCSQSENITSDQEYSTLIQEVERMDCFDRMVDENKNSPKEIETFSLEIRPTHFSVPNCDTSKALEGTSANHYTPDPYPSSPYRINSKLLSVATIYSTESRNDWQSTFMKYHRRRSICK